MKEEIKEKTKEFWEVVRENLVWYREQDNPDHGDLVIAEEAICDYHKKALLLQRQEIADKVKGMKMKEFFASDFTKGENQASLDHYNQALEDVLKIIKEEV